MESGVAVVVGQDEFAGSNHGESREVVGVQIAGGVREVFLDLRFSIAEFCGPLAKLRFVHSFLLLRLNGLDLWQWSRTSRHNASQSGGATVDSNGL